MSTEKTYGIKFKDKLGYALGDTGGCLTFAVIGSFLQMFYTDVLYLDSKKIMMLLIIARLWDAMNDPMWGAFVDSRRPSKKGKFLPYIRWGSIPLAISGILVFLKIPGLSEGQYLAYAYVTYILYGMMYTVVTIPYGSLASVVTTDELERSSLSMFRSIGAGLGGLPGQIILPLFVYTTVTAADGAVKKVLDGDRLLLGISVLAILSVGVYFVCTALSKERVKTLPTAEKSNPKRTIKYLIKNRPFIALCIASMFLLATQQYTQTLYNYLFKDYFKQPELYALVTVITYLPMALLLPFMQKLVRRFGKKEICAFGMCVATLANLALLVLKTHSVAVFFALSFVAGFGMMFFILEIWALATDVIDYQEKLSGQRDEGTSYAFFSFTRKLGQTVSGVLGTGVLSLIGYDAKAITAETVSKMYTVSAAVPALTCFIMALSLGVFYNLGKEKLKEVYGDKE